MHTCMAVYMYVCSHQSHCLSLCILVWPCICMCVAINLTVSLYAYLYGRVYVCVYPSIWLSLFMLTCMAVYMYVCIHQSGCLSLCLLVWPCICMCVAINLAVSLYAYLYGRVYVCVYPSIWLSLFMHTCMAVYMYVVWIRTDGVRAFVDTVFEKNEFSPLIKLALWELAGIKCDITRGNVWAVDPGIDLATSCHVHTAATPRRQPQIRQRFAKLCHNLSEKAFSRERLRLYIEVVRYISRFVL